MVVIQQTVYMVLVDLLIQLTNFQLLNLQQLQVQQLGLNGVDYSAMNYLLQFLQVLLTLT
jgi:hypothetical protein